MKIYTSRYGNSQSVKAVDAVPVRTSVGAPRASFHYEAVLDLAPQPSWLRLPYDLYRPRYLEKVEELGVHRIQLLLDEAGAGRDVVLLCYENLLVPGSWCHRRLFADWWTEQTGEPVQELDDRPPRPRRTRQVTLLGVSVSAAVHSKAERLIKAGKVEYVADGRWRVEGDSSTYDVTEEECSCPTGPELLCSHRLAIKLLDGGGRLFDS